MLPSKELFSPISMVVGRMMAKGRRPKLTTELVPEGSVLRRKIEESEKNPGIFKKVSMSIGVKIGSS
jgi:hypothetical protein